MGEDGSHQSVGPVGLLATAVITMKARKQSVTPKTMAATMKEHSLSMTMHLTKKSKGKG